MTLQERLRSLFPASSGRRRKRWLTDGRVRVNGEVIRRGDVAVGAHDRVELGRPSLPLPAPLRLVHQDEHVFIIDKPAGLLTIATETEKTRTAYRVLRDWAHGQALGKIFIVHRLDRETSGLLVFARSPAARAALQAQFEARTPERVYVARVEGLVRAAEGELISRLVQDRSLRVRLGTGRASKPAITRYRVLERYRDATLLELTLVTGRRGQIRVQLAGLGHPIVGDRAYGSGKHPFGRVCLHAARLGFVHPGGTRVVFESPVPAEFKRA